MGVARAGLASYGVGVDHRGVPAVMLTPKAGQSFDGPPKFSAMRKGISHVLSHVVAQTVVCGEFLE